jgi:hypothetical protein
MTRIRGGPKKIKAWGRIDEDFLDFLDFPNTMNVKEIEREKERGIPSSILIDEVKN